MRRLVMFDLDGTLVDTAGEIADAVNETLVALGHQAAPDPLVRQWIGGGTRELMARACGWATGANCDTLRGSNVVEQAMAAFEGPYTRRCGTRSRPYPGAGEVLAALRERGVRTAIVTNKEERFARKVLAAHRLAADALFAGDTLPRRKPDPLPILAAMVRFHSEAEESLVVGDSQVDLLAARNAGVECWLVDYGYDNAPAERRGRPDAVIGCLDAILARTEEQPCP